MMERVDKIELQLHILTKAVKYALEGKQTDCPLCECNNDILKEALEKIKVLQ